MLCAFSKRIAKWWGNAWACLSGQKHLRWKVRHCRKSKQAKSVKRSFRTGIRMNLEWYTFKVEIGLEFGNPTAIKPIYFRSLFGNTGKIWNRKEIMTDQDIARRKWLYQLSCVQPRDASQKIPEFIMCMVVPTTRRDFQPRKLGRMV